MRDITDDDIEALVSSLLNYYLLVKCGAIHDPNVGPDFLEAIKKISNQGPTLFENIL